MIRKAAAADLPGIGAIYEAIFDQEAQGPVYTNWLRGTYPTVDSARQVLEAGTLYVGEEDGVLWGVLNLTAFSCRSTATSPGPSPRSGRRWPSSIPCASTPPTPERATPGK